MNIAAVLYIDIANCYTLMLQGLISLTNNVCKTYWSLCDLGLWLYMYIGLDLNGFMYLMYTLKGHVELNSPMRFDNCST